MDSPRIGAQFLQLFQGAPSRVVLVAPFIKTGALQRILEQFDHSIAHVDCVTRWHPADIADGVCDLEILEMLQALPNASLWVRRDLHAKYFRADGQCLVGSANLTGKAFGWRLPGNLELMVELPATFVGLEDWERSLLASCLPATRDLRDRIAAEAQELLAITPSRPSPDVEADHHPDESWMPLCSRPDLLFGVSPPPNLPEPLFNLHVANALRQLTVIREVMDATAKGIPDRHALEIIVPYHDAEQDVSINDAWRILKDWIMHFFPGEFRIEADQEVLVRGRQY